MKKMQRIVFLVLGLALYAGLVSAQRPVYEPVQVYKPGDKADRVVTVSDSTFFAFIIKIDEQSIYYYRFPADKNYMRFPLSQIKMIQYADGAREYRPGATGVYTAIENTGRQVVVAPSLSTNLMIVLDTLKTDSKYDQIVLMNATVIKGRVDRIGTTEISFYKAERPNGPVYTELKSNVACLYFKNGSKDCFYEENQRLQAQSQVPVTAIQQQVQPQQEVRQAAPAPQRMPIQMLSVEEAKADPKRREYLFIDVMITSGFGGKSYRFDPNFYGDYVAEYTTVVSSTFMLKIFGSETIDHFIGGNYALAAFDDGFGGSMGLSIGLPYQIFYKPSPRLSFVGMIRPSYGLYDADLEEAFTRVDFGAGAIYRFTDHGWGVKAMLSNSVYNWFEFGLHFPLHNRVPK